MSKRVFERLKPQKGGGKRKTQRVSFATTGRIHISSGLIAAHPGLLQGRAEVFTHRVRDNKDPIGMIVKVVMVTEEKDTFRVCVKTSETGATHANISMARAFQSLGMDVSKIEKPARLDFQVDENGTDLTVFFPRSLIERMSIT